jgi:Mn2+/Fe2+ NRAMP family transporter
VKKVLAVFLGILTAIGGFVDMGDLVANAATGARFRMGLAWVVPIGVIGIIVYAEMAGRVAAISQRPVFELVRERLGPGVGLVNLAASFFINLLTLIAEIAGVAIAISLVVSVSYLLLLPVAGFLVWVVIWRMPFEWMERVFGLGGLALLVFAVTVWKIGPDWGQLLHDSSHPSIAPHESPFNYAYYAIALFGAAMTPYEVFFFSSGAVEDGWTEKDLALNRANVFIGFPLGGALSLALMACAHLVLAPHDISVDQLSQVLLPATLVVGKLGLAAAILGIFAATFGAALETGLSAGYTLSQYLGWPWGKHLRAGEASRFHLVVLVSVVLATLLGLSGVDPVKVTEYSIVLSAAALPLTYFPILVIANDRGYMGEKVNGRFLNTIGTIYLVLLVIIAIVTIPLMIITRGGA